jgi:hypothetical protein
MIKIIHSHVSVLNGEKVGDGNDFLWSIGDRNFSPPGTAYMFSAPGSRAVVMI